MVLRREQDGSRRQTQRQVGTGGLPELVVVHREVQNVVDDLERKSQVVAVLLRGGRHFGVGGVAREQGATARRVANE